MFITVLFVVGLGCEVFTKQ